MTTTSRPNRKVLQTTALTGLLLAALAAPTFAADFPGTLKGVAITDAQATNKAPVAAFTYTTNGDTVTFDASGSSDPDGSIAKYKWDFGNGTLSEGAVTTYTLTDATRLQVTLTVVDDSNGAAISQKIITPLTNSIADDFSTNTSADYIIVNGSLNVSNGVAYSEDPWKILYAIHTKDLPSIDHAVEADIYYDGANASGGLLFRVNSEQKTGYSVSFAGGRIGLSNYNSGIEKWVAHFDGKYPEGTHRARCEISGQRIKVYVNNILAIESMNSDFNSGKQIGIKINPYGKNTVVYVDNLKSE